MKLTHALANWIMLSCKRATQLMEKKLHFGLTPIEKIQLRMHKKACAYCTSFEKQSDLIHEVLCEGLQKDLENHNHGLSEKEKSGMISDIAKEIS